MERHEQIVRAASFHPSEYIKEEMEYRGWSRDMLAAMMLAGVSDVVEAMEIVGRLAKQERIDEYQIMRCAVDMYLEVGPTTPALRLGEMAADFSRAFGASEELFTNLETAWLAGQG